jgi:hypothetical protein
MIRLAAVFLIVTACSVRIDRNSKFGRGEAKTVICHKGKKTLSISDAAVEAHLKHGDLIGACL